MFHALLRLVGKKPLGNLESAQRIVISAARYAEEHKPSPAREGYRISTTAKRRLAYERLLEEDGYTPSQAQALSMQHILEELKVHQQGAKETGSKNKRN